ncbi:hypothetical protein QO019_003821 [Streptomyces thermodiastaticus]|uniref:Uncharacterized protein n=1 Tax=Streptomyces thermodiastaticus TaxID=44061 RepID=A0ABU0KLT8_9ACTN|nr:hypothetical protein [Streptomyces thermodiastaticus]UVT12925.1 hypothetical protein AY578_28970 [Streptomyces thermocarboxydus]
MSTANDSMLIEPPGGLPDHEDDHPEATLELSFRRALCMIRTEGINDAKTVMPLRWAALEGPFAGVSAE